VAETLFHFSLKGESMSRSPWRGLGRVTLAVTLVAAASLPALAQTPGTAPTATPTPGFSSKPVLVAPITGIEGKQVVLVSVSLAPGASSPAHSHPGDCYGSVLEGVIELRLQGQEPRRIAAGESYATLGSVPHQFTNVGEGPVRLLNALIVEKGRPATQPASAPTR
jgi:quercetin dioxygenase-like cupin family protein